MGLLSSILPAIGTAIGGPVGGMIGSAVGGVVSGVGASKADRQQQAGFNQAIDLEELQFQEALKNSQLPTLARDRATAQIMIDLGLGDPSQFQGAAAGATGGAAGTPGFMENLQGFTPTTQELTPSQQAMLDLSTRGVEQSAAARGGLMSGNTLLALQGEQVRYREGLRQNRLKNLMDIAGMSGQQSQAGQAMSGSLGQNLSDLYSTRGQARASGTLGRTSTFNQTLENLGEAASSFLKPNSPVSTSGVDWSAWGSNF